MNDIGTENVVLTYLENDLPDNTKPFKASTYGSNVHVNEAKEVTPITQSNEQTQSKLKKAYSAR